MKTMGNLIVHKSNRTGFYSAQYIYVFKLTVSLCFASKIILETIANANKLAVLSIMLNSRGPKLFVHK